MRVVSPMIALGRYWVPPGRRRMRAGVRLGRDHYARVDSNDYSVHPAVVGRKVDIRADLDTVRVRCGEQLVAEHVRCWGHHQTISECLYEVVSAKPSRQPKRVNIPGCLSTESA